MLQTIKDRIDESDYVLVGIGEKFGYDWRKLEKDSRYIELLLKISEDKSLEWLIPFLQKTAMDRNPDEQLAKAYEKLAEITNGKDAFFITTTIDDYIYDTSIRKDRIVTPCGGFKKLQCEKACTHDLINVPNALLQYVQKLYNKEMSLDEMRDKYPECPECGANLIFNQIGNPNYVEAGYLTGWGIYHKWLEMTMNRKITILELGAGFGFMTVIRSPFEKLVEYNRKSIMYRVHPSLYMSAEGMEDRCISVKENPIDLFADNR